MEVDLKHKNTGYNLRDRKAKNEEEGNASVGILENGSGKKSSKKRLSDGRGFTKIQVRHQDPNASDSVEEQNASWFDGQVFTAESILGKRRRKGTILPEFDQYYKEVYNAMIFSIIFEDKL